MAFSDYVKQTWQDNNQTYPVSAARLGVIEDGIFNAHYMPAVHVYHNATQAINSGVTTALSFNSERFDQAANAADTMHSTVSNTSRLTCRYAGIYWIRCRVQWAANATGTRYTQLRLNGSTALDEDRHAPGNATDNLNMNCDTLWSLSVNDYVEVVVYQNSGGPLNINAATGICEFMMVRVA